MDGLRAIAEHEAGFQMPRDVGATVIRLPRPSCDRTIRLLARSSDHGMSCRGRVVTIQAW